MELTRAEKLAQLDKLLQSRILHGSESLRAFLRFVVLKTIDDQESSLKEYTIATEVFGRNSNYDSRNDSVVRVQAGRLRTKLHEYYASEGKDDKVMIDLPKGQYTPVFSYFESQNGAALLSDSSVENTLAPAPVEAPVNNQISKRWKIATLTLGLLSLLLVLVVVKYQSDASQLRQQTMTQTAQSAEVQAALPLWGGLLNSREPVILAFSNTRFQGTAETGMRLLKPLVSADTKSDSPTAAQNTDDSPSGVITDHYTGVGEVMGMYSLADFFSKTGHPFRARRSLLLTYEDFKAVNIVILGSPAENLLLRDLPQKQDFVFQVLKDENGKPTLGIVNTKPKAAEQETYVAKQEGPSRSQISEDYAVISLLRGLGAENRLLILAGITTFGTQAAAEYVTKPEYVNELISHLRLSKEGEPAKLPEYFQVLVKVKVNGGVPVQLSYVTHHVL